MATTGHDTVKSPSAPPKSDLSTIDVSADAWHLYPPASTSSLAAHGTGVLLTAIGPGRVLAAAELPADKIAGRRLRATFALHSSLDAGTVQLVLRIESAQATIAVIRQDVLLPVDGPSTLDVHVPTDAHRAWLGVLSKGVGTLSIDSAQVEVEHIDSIEHNGRVLTTDGTPMANATVAVSRQGFTSVIAWARTKTDGSYSLRLPLDEYTITITSTTHQPASFSLPRGAGLVAETVLHPAESAAEGTLTVRGAQTGSEFLINFEGESGEHYYIATEVGNYSVALPAGGYFVSLEDAALVQQGRDVVVPGRIDILAHTLPSLSAPVTPILRADLEAATLEFEGDTPPAQLVDEAGRHAILLVGEPTHGTAESFEVRLALLKPLVLTKRFGAVVLEAGWAETLALDDYVVHGTGDLDTALLGTLTWNTQTAELRSLAQWLRTHNAPLPLEKRVHIFGADMQRSDTTLNVVRTLLARAGDVCSLNDEALSILNDERAYYMYRGQTPETIEMARLELARARACVSRARRAIQRTLKADIWRLETALDVVAQTERLFALPVTETFSRRDEYMADAIQRAAKAVGNRGVLVALHNLHSSYARWADGFLSVGHYLRERLGSKVYVILISIHDVSFLALDARHGSMITPGVIPISIPPPDAETFTGILADPTGHPTAMLFSKAPKNVREWLGHWHLFREVGGQFSTIEQMSAARTPISAADAVIVLAHGRASTPIAHADLGQ